MKQKPYRSNKQSFASKRNWSKAQLISMRANIRNALKVCTEDESDDLMMIDRFIEGILDDWDFNYEKAKRRKGIE